MTWHDTLQILDIATRVLGALAIVVVWLIARTVVTKVFFNEWLEGYNGQINERLKPIEMRLNRGDTAFEVIRNDEKHRPARQDIDAFRRDLGMVNLSLVECATGLNALKERFGHTESQVDTLVRLQLGANR